MDVNNWDVIIIFLKKDYSFFKLSKRSKTSKLPGISMQPWCHFCKISHQSYQHVRTQYFIIH